MSRLTNTAGEACSGGAQEILPIFANTRVTSWGGNQRLCIPKGAGAEAATAERMGRAARVARAARAAMFGEGGEGGETPKTALK